jgi:ABC-2 type transport system ATP-binding protein
MIELTGVTKEYEGVTALKGISFTVPTGSICGFIGPNGAGKTTTLKILGTLLRPTGGSAHVMGVDVNEHPEEVRRLVGWMPDQYGVYMELRVWEYLDFFAAAYAIPRRRRRDVIEMVLDLVDLTSKRDSRVGALSRGMTQKLCLGRALVHEPQVLLLDEPASGLDPEARIELRELFKELQRMGKTILVSSHILPELAEYCNGVAIIQGGEVKFSGSLADLSAGRAEGARLFSLKVVESPERAVELLKARPEVKRVALRDDGEIEMQVSGDEKALSALLDHLVSNRAGVWSYREAELDLGDVFLKITGSDHA